MSRLSSGSDRYRGVTTYLFLLVVLWLSACRAQPRSPTLEPRHLLATLAPLLTARPSPTAILQPSVTVLPSVTLTPAPTMELPKIDRSPRAATIEDWSPWAGRILTATLVYNPASTDMWQMDLRTQDLSQMDLRYSSYDLLAAATFDERTIWPEKNRMPTDFDPQRILEAGKNPGLDVRSLHASGITGKGVGIAIIDMPLLVEHQEYRDQLRLYEELFFDKDSYQQPANMHGPAVASIAVGQTVGVAPQADLYYIAVDLANGQDASGNYQYDLTLAAQAIRRILEINQGLPADRKIRLISMSFGWTDALTGYKEITAAVEEARAQGIFILCAYPAMEQIYGFKSYGLERSPQVNPDFAVSYSRAHLCDLYAKTHPLCQAGRLLVPMSSRTTASPMGKDEYVFYRIGDEGWTIPYLAGMYALAAQVDADITPERFWELALQTGRRMNITGSFGVYTLGPVLDPVVLIEVLRK
jgi:hypothetical protein